MSQGGWILANMQAVMLPEEVDVAFRAATKTQVGATYTPVLYAGHQIVRGINYMLFCRQVLSNQNQTEHLVKMIINAFAEDYSIISIETII